MNFRSAAVVLVAGIITAWMTGSCSEKPAPDNARDAKTSAPPAVSEVAKAQGTAELKPPSEGKIGKDCVAFLRSTKVVPAQGAAATDCPGCPAGGPEVLTVRQIKTEAVSCSGETCNVVVKIRAIFNPAAGEAMAGGLTAWISPEQRSAYLQGQTPEGEQEFRVQVTYKRDGPEWRVVEFERPAAAQ